MLKCVDLSLGSNYRSMMQLKVTALMGADLCKKLAVAHTQPSGAEDLGVHRVMEVMDGQDLTFPSLTDLETQHLWASLRRLNDIGQYAKQNGVRLLVDAEYTYLNPALSLVTMALMGRFNVSEPAIWNTYQCYLKHCDARLSADVEWASSRGLCFGVKLVRGAYMEKERELAKRLGYPDPIQASWEDTNSNYQKLLDKMLELVREKRQKFSLVIATHNETSVTHALRRMGELGIGCDNESLSPGDG
ncbi:hydroxyproline dehydrogenase, partial [Scyliorhinus torazame]|uniref:hydroxyproline dehydrogenase n=1 Tax=Scyliorhinus torazame TaxID=75743 RepID=UPI003B5A0E9F